MRQLIAKQQFDEERALYNLTSADVVSCIFAGEADGESVLKEARDVRLENCSFSLRYPLWHVQGFQLHGCSMDEKTRAAIWYARDGQIENSNLGGIKALRECQNITIRQLNTRTVARCWVGIKRKLLTDCQRIFVFCFKISNTMLGPLQVNHNRNGRI